MEYGRIPQFMLFLETAARSVEMRRTLLQVAGFLVLWIIIDVVVNRPIQHLSTHLSSQLSSRLVIVHPVYVNSVLQEMEEEEEAMPSIPGMRATPLDVQMEEQETVGIEGNTTEFSTEGVLEPSESNSELQENDGDAEGIEKVMFTSIPPSSALPTEISTESPTRMSGCGSEANPCDVVMTLSAECSTVTIFSLIIVHVTEETEANDSNAVLLPTALLLQGGDVLHVKVDPLVLQGSLDPRRVLLYSEYARIARSEEHDSVDAAPLHGAPRWIHEQRHSLLSQSFRHDAFPPFGGAEGRHFACSIHLLFPLHIVLRCGKGE